MFLRLNHLAAIMGSVTTLVTAIGCANHPANRDDNEQGSSLTTRTLTCDGGTPTEGGRVIEFGPPNAPSLGEWPMFKRNLAHTGLAGGSGGLGKDSHCLRWSHKIAGLTRGNSGPLIAKVKDEWLVLIATSGSCQNDLVNSAAGSQCTRTPNVRGTVWALNAATGAFRWKTELPWSVDPYAPLLVDLDRDGRRELVVPANDGTGGNHIYAIRTEEECGHPAGSIKWDTTYLDSNWTSETAPVAVDIDPSTRQLEVVFGVGSVIEDAGQAAKVFVLDGVTGAIKGTPFEVGRRSRMTTPNGLCSGGDKVDSASPAVASINGVPTVFVGAWDGTFYALQWQSALDAGGAGLTPLWRDVLPRYTDAGQCPIRKVRNGAVIGSPTPGAAPVVAFGYMAEPNGTGQGDFTTATLRVLDMTTGSFIAKFPDYRDWKSTPSFAPLDPNASSLDIVGGEFLGVYALKPQGSTFAQLWNQTPVGDGNVSQGTAGPRSSPAVANIDGQAGLEVIIGVEGNVDPGLHVLEGATGRRKWMYPVAAPGVASSPAVGDIDGDGSLEIVFFDFSGNVYALDNESCVSR